MPFQPKKLEMSIALALSIASQSVHSQFNIGVDLSNLNGQNGFVINGENGLDYSGMSVSAAGDFNGDGVDDVLIGAFGADPGGIAKAGKSYVVFGSDSNILPNPVNLSSLNGQNGFVFNGETNNDYSGRSVSAAGDFNGDGIDDVLIGAFGADPGGNFKAGKSYVVFGSSSGTLPNVSSMNGQNGIMINGEIAYDRSGRSVSTAGDIMAMALMMF